MSYSKEDQHEVSESNSALGLMRGKRNSSQYTAVAAAPAPESGSTTGLEQLLAGNAGPAEFCAELAKLFQIKLSEVGLLRLEKGSLRFLFPEELKIAGSIPLTSSSSVASHTAMTKRLELFNNFPQVKHASIFETVKLAQQSEQPDPLIIQKLISGPVQDESGRVIGVLQVCRKGYDLRSAGPDFSLDDLQQLERAAHALANAVFMKNA